MTTRPRLRTSSRQVVGLLSLALFAVLAAVFVTAEFGDPAGFPEGSITASIGYALLNLPGDVPSEGFLVALIIIAVVLDAALDGAVMLAKREEEETATDGGVDRAAGTDPGVDRDGRRGGED